MMEWTFKPFAGLSTEDLYAVLKLRAEVFVVEQNCAYLDPDGMDVHPHTLHLMGKDENRELMAYLRILPPGVRFHEPSIGRVVTAKKDRGQGLCRAMMEKALERIGEIRPGLSVKISAQVYLEGFYRSLGFETVSDPYPDDGILHVDMVRKG